MSRRLSQENNLTEIDRRRIALGMTRSSLAEKSGVPLRTIENWCTRTRLTRDAYQLRKVAKALDCQIEDIMEPE